MINPSTLTFLEELRKNNNRAWMQEHRDEYLAAKANVEEFVLEVIEDVSAFDPRVVGLTPKQFMFRLHRDVRFSHNKLPYKTHFGAVIGPDGRKSPGGIYYVHIEPNATFVGGGVWHPEREQLANIRKSIDRKGNEFQKILDDTAFTKNFGELQGDTLKTAPRDYPKDHKYIDILRHKDFVASHYMTDNQITSKNAVKQIVQLFESLQPMNRWLDNAI